ncbi:MAG: ImmA/IrrE family metallo-endopeptidase [Terrisporobacter sp.]
MVNLIKNHPNCKIVTYSKFMYDYNCSLNDLVKMGGSVDGFTSKKGTKFIVFYNDLIKSEQRQVWTLAHEFAHIVIGHLDFGKSKLFRNELSNNEYSWMEKEADFFASQLLANDLILKELKVKNSYELSKLCNISNEASKNRFNSFNNINNNVILSKHDIIVINQFKDFINKKVCPKCGFEHIGDKINFCPICCTFDIEFERIYPVMIYNDAYELDEKSKALKCPVCNNEEIPKNGEYCNICGIYLINKCSKSEHDINGNPYYECGELAYGNSRFCTACGTETTFFKNKLLVSFDIYKKDKE